MEQFIAAKRTIQELLVDQSTQFIIPTYQRPYVWQDEQIIKLLEDVYKAFKADQSIYFIGNVYVTQGLDQTIDLVDGQQRFTTLWLTALAFQKLGISTSLLNFLKGDNRLRLGFTIRRQVEDYLRSRSSSSPNYLTEIEIENDEFLKYIVKGLSTILGFLEANVDLAKFGNYLYERVVFVYNQAPLHTDLNALFTALGNSGVQLEQTDILKSKLLKLVEDKVPYALLWESCENMNDYFERNVQSNFSLLSVNPDINKFATFDQQVFIPKKISHTAEPAVGATIAQIVGLTATLTEQNIQNSKNKPRCRSIIPFSILLLHAYRIFRYQNEKQDIKFPFHSKYLLQTFQELIDEPSLIPEFMKTLWEVRYTFDRYIVKWRLDSEDELQESEEEKLRLTSVRQVENSWVRDNLSSSADSMLQSVLYYTGSYGLHFWLTPYLSWLISNSASNADVTSALELIDNSMVPGEKKQISWRLLKELNIWPSGDQLETLIGQSQGTHFSHYWFYKIEYLLWKSWDKSDPRIANYRITAKNSIEHVYPQNHEYKLSLEGDDAGHWLNSLGNLGLLSVGQNSSYSNQKVEKKKSDFDDKNKQTYDSLKLAKIYESPEIMHWNVEGIRRHEEAIMRLLKQHYQNVVKG